jgi:archaellum component FlaC
MDKVTEEYIEQVRTLNEAIAQISKQTKALGENLEEMETLRRNLTGVNAIYEIQLRNASGQLNSLDQINEQTQKMAHQVEELNSLYTRMIEAMTTNTNRQQI